MYRYRLDILEPYVYGTFSLLDCFVISQASGGYFQKAPHSDVGRHTDCSVSREQNYRNGHDELYRPSDRRLSAKLVQTFADSGCHVVSVTDPYSSNLVFRDRSRYVFLQAAPQLYPRV
jgi:hypothetical protein